MKKQKKPYIPLTIDGAETKAAIKSDLRFVKPFCRRYKVPESTLCEILSGRYEHVSDHPKSKYQCVLQTLKRAGYLVQLDQPLDMAA